MKDFKLNLNKFWLNICYHFYINTISLILDFNNIKKSITYFIKYSLVLSSKILTLIFNYYINNSEKIRIYLFL